MRRRAIAAIAALTATLLLLTGLRAEAHPLHTTLTEVAVTPNGIRANVRIFADDLARAVGRRNADADIETYVASSVAFFDEHNRPLAARGCGIKRSGELVWVCIQTASTTRVSLRNSLLCETFKDQINIVQLAAGGTKRGLVFTRGDRPKRLF
jgi:hypothetical protein